MGLSASAELLVDIILCWSLPFLWALSTLTFCASFTASTPKVQ